MLKAHGNWQLASEKYFSWRLAPNLWVWAQERDWPTEDNPRLSSTPLAALGYWQESGPKVCHGSGLAQTFLLRSFLDERKRWNWPDEARCHLLRRMESGMEAQNQISFLYLHN